MISQTTPFVLTPLSSNGPGGTSQQVTINNSMFTTSRLSSQDSLPLMTRIIVSPMNANLNGTVVDCFEGSSSTVSIATTTIRIIDPGQFGKIIIIYYDLRSGMMILYSGLLLAHICILDYEKIIQIAI